MLSWRGAFTLFSHRISHCFWFCYAQEILLSSYTAAISSIGPEAALRKLMKLFLLTAEFNTNARYCPALLLLLLHLLPPPHCIRPFDPSPPLLPRGAHLASLALSPPALWLGTAPRG